MNKMRNEERRKYLRLKVYHLVKYRLVQDKPPYFPYSLAAIKDIGAGGICLVSEKPLPVSTNLELQINFPDIEKPISTLGRVVWLKQMPKTDRYEMGIEFTSIEESLRKFIDEYVRFVYSKLKLKNIAIPKPV